MTRITADDLAVLLIDVQPLFLKGAVGTTGPLLARLASLLKLTTLLDLPLLATFERPVDVKGELAPELEPTFPSHGQRFEKSTFDALGEADIRDALAATACSTVAVAGSETDVCVLQTVIGLQEHGYGVVLLEDCLFTSEHDPSAALRRMRALGAVPTTFKSLAYELVRSVDRSTWSCGAAERIAADPTLFADPEDLPPRVEAEES